MMALIPFNSFAQCIVSIAPLKASPSHKSEMVSQLLFGEKVMLSGEGFGNWIEVVSAIDNYKGWCLSSQVQSITRKQYKQPIKKLIGLAGAVVFTKDFSFPIAAGSDVTLLRKGVSLHEDAYLKLKGKIAAYPSGILGEQHLKEITNAFLNTPYVWGGKSMAGIDCSGFVQIVFRYLGIYLPRDASQQVTVGDTIYMLQETKLGDLAFFDNEEGRITHVGIILDHSHIIHASESAGGVAIDRIDQEGIVSIKLKKRTHRLRTIKRVLV